MPMRAEETFPFKWVKAQCAPNVKRKRRQETCCGIGYVAKLKERSEEDKKQANLKDVYC